MPTLPGRATSILAVLSGFSPSERRVPTRFNWPAVVQEARPGNMTEGQRRQAARVARMQQDLAAWAHQLGLPADHIEESALYATVTTPATMEHEQAIAIASTICWIYAVDDFLDKQDLLRAVVDQRKAATSRDTSVDRSLGAILAPVAPLARRSMLRRYRLMQTRSREMPADASPLSGALREALRTLFADLHARWKPLPSTWGRRRFRIRTAAEQVAACVAMMRQEFGWNIALAERPHAPGLPPFARYIKDGAVSIGMPAVASVVAGFEATPRRVWRRSRKAIAAAGRIVRLTNDLHTYAADVEEGKVTAITIRLQELGYPPTGWDPETSPEVRRAQASVADDLAQAIDMFSRHSVAVPPGLLSHYLRHSVAFALAVYGDGNMFRGEGPDSR